MRVPVMMRLPPAAPVTNRAVFCEIGMRLEKQNRDFSWSSDGVNHTILSKTILGEDEESGLFPGTIKFSCKKGLCYTKVGVTVCCFGDTSRLGTFHSSRVKESHINLSHSERSLDH